MNAKKVATKRIESHIDFGLNVDYLSGEYTAVASESIGEEKPYSISYHKGRMPAFQTARFETIEELAAAMKEIADLRTWRVNTYE